MNEMFGQDEPVFIISVAARMLGLRTQTLRYYERLGLIEPSRTRGNQRVFSRRDIERVQLKVPEGSQNGQRIRLSGQGMPKLNNAGTRGDLYVTLRPTLPKVPTDQERELFRSLRELRASTKD